MNRILNNGAKLIAQVPDNRRPGAFYITADINNREYVTWWMNDKGNCFWGHYCFEYSAKGKEAAIADMLKRAS